MTFWELARTLVQWPLKLIAAYLPFSNHDEGILVDEYRDIDPAYFDFGWPGNQRFAQDDLMLAVGVEEANPEDPPPEPRPLTAFPELPLEIYLLIVGCVMALAPRDDARSRAHPRRTLSACASVCRVWSQHFQPPLFEQLAFASEPDLRGFAALLEAPTSKIRKYVRQLELQEKEGSAPWAHVGMRVLFKNLPSLHSLMWSVRRRSQDTMDDLSPSDEEEPLNPVLSLVNVNLDFIGGLNTITTLTLKDCLCSNFRALARALQALPQLLDLHLERVSWGGQPPSAQEERMLLRPKRASVLRRVVCIDIATPMLFLRLCSRCRAASVAELPLVVALREDEIGGLVSLATALLNPEDAVFPVTVFHLQGCM
jgi:hypothetical protein